MPCQPAPGARERWSDVAGGDVDGEPVELGRHLDLAGEPAGLAPIVDAHLEEVLLDLVRLTDEGHVLLAHEDVARPARGIAAALTDDAGDAVLHGGRHDRLALDGVDGALVAGDGYVSHLRHGPASSRRPGTGTAGLVCP